MPAAKGDVGLERALAEQIAGFVFDPLGFVKFNFKWGEGDLKDFDGPDVWQAEILETLGKELLRAEKEGGSIQLAVASGHGIGKSALISWIIDFWMSTRPDPQVVVTANTSTQLETKTWRELAVWHKRSLNAHWFVHEAQKFYHVDNPKTWFASPIPWNEAKPEAFAGTHAKDVLYLFDEASAIPDAIWEVSEGAMTTPGATWVAFGNPTQATGRFRECFRRFKHRWITRQIDSRSAKMADKKKINEWIEDYGEDSDFARIRIKGEFPRTADRQFIGDHIVQQAQSREPVGDGPMIMGVDVARFGKNDTVVCRRQGDKVFPLIAWNGLDTMQTAMKVGEMIKAHGPDAVMVDGVGVGGGVVDRLRMLGFDVLDVNSGARASEEDVYTNLRAEMWAKLRADLGRSLCLPFDDKLSRELTSIEYDFDRRNRLMLERKEDMVRRGVESPDRADALALTYAAPVTPKVWADAPLAAEYGTIA